MLARGALLVEWPERVRSALPDDHLWADFDAPDSDSPQGPGRGQGYDDLREMRFKARGSRYETILAALRREVYGGD
jgi:tRNA A37 threonylcarbamoyladenosine biosynthesis protein TsaE